MAPKKKSRGSTSASGSGSTHAARLVDLPPHEQVEMVAKRLTIHHLIKERQLIVNTPTFREMMRHYHMVYWTDEPSEIHEGWVREFYAYGAVFARKRRKPEDDTIVVRGMVLDMSVEGIGRFLRFAEAESCAFYHLKLNQQNSEKKRVMEAVSEPRTKWDDPYVHIHRSSLLQPSYILHEMIRATVLPTSQMSEVNVERLKLIYAMSQRLPIKFAEILHKVLQLQFKRMWSIALKPGSRRFAFLLPSFITSYCRAQGCPVLPGEVFIPPGPPLEDTEPVPPRGVKPVAKRDREASGKGSGGPAPTMRGLWDKMESVTQDIAQSRARDQASWERQELMHKNMMLQGQHTRELIEAMTLSLGGSVSAFPDLPEYSEFPPAPPPQYQFEDEDADEDEEDDEEDADDEEEEDDAYD